MKIELRLVFDHYEAIWNAIRSGSIDPSIAQPLMHRWLGFTFSWSILRDLWKTMEGEYGADFVAYINEYMNSNPATVSEAEQLELLTRQ